MSRPPDKTLPARDKRMHDLRRSGHSLEDIAQLHRVSRATAARGVRRHKESATKMIEQGFIKES